MPETRLPLSLQEDILQKRTDRWTIVWTPAVPSEFSLLGRLRQAGFTVHKRAQILGKLSENRPVLAVAGTHGKTTTSTLLAHLLHTGKIPVEAFLGGISLGEGEDVEDDVDACTTRMKDILKMLMKEREDVSAQWFRDNGM